jgi:hypothetical protein
MKARKTRLGIAAAASALALVFLGGAPAANAYTYASGVKYCLSNKTSYITVSHIGAVRVYAPGDLSANGKVILGIGTHKVNGPRGGGLWGVSALPGSDIGRQVVGCN